jgi:hypothetical protein
MNWNAIGAAGEVFGAIAVVVSVVYLAIQVRKQTEEARLAATRELAAQFQSMLEPIAHDSGFSAIYKKGVMDYLNLSDNERLQMAYHFAIMFRIFEQQYLHTTRRNVDPIYFESVNLVLFDVLTLPGVQQWWELSNSQFCRPFHSYVEENLVSAKARGYQSSFAPKQADSSRPAQ